MTFSILDWRNCVNKTFLNRFLDSCSDNRKSKACPFDKLRAGSEPRRRIENPKWMGIFAIVLTFVIGGAVAQAQQPAKVPRIGYLVSRSEPGPNDRAFQEALRELGYIEGQNIIVERRWAGGDPERVPDLAADLVRLKVDVIFAGGGTIGVVKRATGTIPIVFMTEGDPVGSGLVASLARPGGNLTGLTVFADELAGKRLELIKEVIPKISRVAVLRHSTSDVSHLKATEEAAPSLGLQLQILEVRDPNDFDSAFAVAKKGRVNALIELPSSFLSTHRKPLVDLAAKSRLPAIWKPVSLWMLEGSCPTAQSCLNCITAPPRMWIRS
jgi:ABC-type uncharacterized transport system substrate-binding protein